MPLRSIYSGAWGATPNSPR